MAKDSKKSKAKKQRTSPMKRFVSVFAILIASFLTYSAANEVLTTIQLKQEIAEANAELDALKEKEANLNDEKTKLEDPEYVKRYARGKYSLSKEGEVIFKRSQSDETTDSDN